MADSTTTWTGSVSNLWTDPENWTNGVPTYSTTPVINATGPISIDLNGSQSTNTIATSGTGTITFTDGTLALNGNFTMASGQTIVMSGSTLTGQTITTSSGTATTGTITVTNGATIQFDQIDTTINFGPASSSYTNTVNFTDGGKNIPTITNLSPGDKIVFPNKSWNNGINFVATGTDSSGNTTYKINDGYNDSTPLVANVTLAAGIETSDFTWDSSTHAIVCFLAGSMIRTPDGDRAVENIKIGDQVVAFDWRSNTNVSCPVVWAGKAHVTVDPDLPDDEAGYPVRVIKDAISVGVPYKDMLITAEHCLFFEDKFVPVRMLVNGRSIFYDHSISSYDYYHVETEQHSVITADGMLTESYLDTGNRRSFRQEGKVVAFGGNQLSWAEHGGADLSVSREVVEPLFRLIAARAEMNEIPGTTITSALTEDAGLHLTTDTGAIIRMARQANGYAMFMIPAGVTSVRIVSRTSRPSDTIGPFVDDRRRLGVLVGDVKFFDSRQAQKINTHLTEATLTGWDAKEFSPSRWTNGNALLPLGARQHYTIGMLAIKILAAGPYCLSTKTDRRTLRQA